MRFPRASAMAFSLPCFLLLCLNLTNGEAFQSLIRLPQFRITENRNNSKKLVVSVKDFGAKGDAYSDDTQAFKEAWNVTCSDSPAILKIPAGNVYLVGPIDFHGPCPSKVEVLISGTIIAPEDPEIWNGLDPKKWLYFHGVNNLIVEGRGIINGKGGKWWVQSCKRNITNPCRPAPTAITFHRCKKLKVRHLMMLDSQQFHLAFTNCYRVSISHLKVIAHPESPNTDGIHIGASTKVMVRDCIIETGDDCISISSLSSQIIIRNITCGPGHGISIGSLGKGNSTSRVTDILVDGAFLSNTENGVRIKTWQGGSGLVQGIVFRNMLMDNVSNPIIIDQYYCDSFLPCPNQTSAVKVDGVSFMGIRGTSATVEAVRFACSDNMSCDNIYLQDIELSLDSGGAAEAFCWNTFGVSSGLVSPPPCFSLYRNFINYQKVLSSNTLHSRLR